MFPKLAAKALRNGGALLIWYAADETITDVWVWYEAVGANSYLIYIGYA